MKHFIHVTISGGGGCLRTVAVLTRAQVWRVPIPPVMFGVRFLVVVVVLRRFAEKFCKGRDVNGSFWFVLPVTAGKPRRDFL